MELHINFKKQNSESLVICVAEGYTYFPLLRGEGPAQNLLGPIFEFLAYLETTWKNKNFGVG